MKARNFVVKNDKNKGGRHKSKKDYRRKPKDNDKLSDGSPRSTSGEEK